MLKENNFLPIMAMLIFLSGCMMTKTSTNTNSWKGLMYMSAQEMFPGNPHTQALALAAERGDIEEIDKLIDAGADPNATGTYGVAVAQWILLHPNKEGFRRLLEKGADPNKIWFIHYDGTEEQTSLLHETVEQAPIIGTDYLKMTLEIGKGDPNLIPPDKKYRPIDNALGYRNREAFLILYNAGADVNIKDSLGHPLVFNTALSRNYETTLFLLQLGVDYNSTYTGQGIQNINNVINLALSCDVIARYETIENYMWFWRCVDFLEKRGMVFDYTPYKNRPPAVKPAVLDTTPPLSKKAIERMSLTDSVLMHEVELTYPIPLRDESRATGLNTRERTPEQMKSKTLELILHKHFA